MQRFRFPLSVAITSLAVGLILVGIGGLFVTGAFANPAPWLGGPGRAPWMAGGWGPHGGAGFTLPPEIAGLADVPADQRFSHFSSAQLNLTDKDGRPLTVAVMPGTVTAASASSVSLTSNDGTARTFAIDSSTTVRSKGRDAQTSIAQGDRVVVVTLNNATRATAVMTINADGAHGPFGPFGH